MAAFVT